MCQWRKVECHNCHKVGHLARVCRQQTVRAVNHDTHQSDEESVKSDVFTAMSGSSHLYHKVIFDSGTAMQFIIDTGSPISFMSVKDLRRIGLEQDQLQSTRATIKGVSGHDHPVLGQVTASLLDDYAPRTVKINLLITKTGPRVLGLDGLRALGVKVVLAASNSGGAAVPLPADITALIQQCSVNRGGMKTEDIHLEADTMPVFKKARPLAFGLRPAVEHCLQGLVQDGVLRPVESSAWATPIVTPLKSNGLPRICGDFRVTVNSHLKHTATTTLDVEDMFQGLQGHEYFSKIDLTNAFLQIPLDEASKELTTINMMWGLFQYNFLPFGLNVSPAIFQ